MLSIGRQFGSTIKAPVGRKTLKPVNRLKRGSGYFFFAFCSKFLLPKKVDHPFKTCRPRETETDRERPRQTQRETETDRDKQRERET